MESSTVFMFFNKLYPRLLKDETFHALITEGNSRGRIRGEKDGKRVAKRSCYRRQGDDGGEGCGGKGGVVMER